MSNETKNKSSHLSQPSNLSHDPIDIGTNSDPSISKYTPNSQTVLTSMLKTPFQTHLSLTPASGSNMQIQLGLTLYAEITLVPFSVAFTRPTTKAKFSIFPIP